MRGFVGRISSAILFVLLTGSLSALPINLPKIGDDLRVIAKLFSDSGYQNHPTPVKNQWSGSLVSISDFGFTSTSENTSFKLLVCNGEPIGVSFSGTKSSALLDVDGDGKLDIELSDNVFIPCWIFDKDSHGNLIGELFQNALDNQFSMFASNEGADSGKSPYLEKYNEDLSRFMKETDLSDRNLAYRIWFFNAYVNDFPLVARYAIASCLVIYGKKYSKIHPMLSQYMSEMAMRLNDTDDARYFNQLVQKDRPDFIPAKVMATRLLEDKKQREVALGNLKVQFPEHWLLKFY